MKLTKLNPKELIGLGFEVLIALVVATFLALNSFRFWEWTFPPEQWYFAYLGFGLTGGAAIGYLVVFMWRAHTSLRKTIALIMLFVCIVGELLTAGFGIQVEVWKRAGYVLTQDNFNFMTMVVQLLGFIHAIAILAYYAGDSIAEMFGDEDGDGTPNFADRDYRGKKNKNSNNQPRQPKPQQQPQGTSYTLDQFLKQINLTPDGALFIANQSRDHNDAFQKLVVNRNMSDNTDISGKNFRKLYYGELANGHKVNP